MKEDIRKFITKCENQNGAVVHFPGHWDKEDILDWLCDASGWDPNQFHIEPDQPRGWRVEVEPT